MSEQERHSTDPPEWALTAWVLAMAASFLVLLFLARDMTFRSDDWDLVARRSLTDPVGLMRPFNEQWVLIPAVVFRLIFGVVGLSSYLPYVAVLLVLHVTVAEGVRRLVSHAAGYFMGYLAGLVVLFLGSGAENLRWAFQIGMVLSTAAGIWAMYWYARQHSAMVPAAFLLVAVASHAIGAVFVGACIVMAVVRRRPRDVIVFAVPTATFALWLAIWGFPALAERGGTLTAGLLAVPTFVVTGVATAIGAVFGLHTSAGIVLAAIAGSVLALTRAKPANPLVVAASLAALVAEYALVAISRSDYGLSAVAWSRYTYVAVPLVLIAAAAWVGPRLTALATRSRIVPGAIAVAALLAVALNLRAYVESRADELEYVHRSRAIVAVATWSTATRRPASDVHVPDPARLRELVVAYGSPTTDAFVPGVVPPVPAAIGREICREMMLNPRDHAACEAEVAKISAD